MPAEGERMAKDLEIVPSGMALGADVVGVKISSDIGEDTRAALIAAWREHLVLVFRGQRLSDPELLAFSANFGELDPRARIPTASPSSRTSPKST
jgi:taurine dioxygenase